MSACLETLYNLQCIAQKARLHNVTYFAAANAAGCGVHQFDAAEVEECK